MIELGGLWAYTDKNKNPFFTGSFGRKGVIKIFKNKYKKEESHPDYIMYLDEKEEKENNAVNEEAPF